MGLKYTGLSSVLDLGNGKVYATQKLYDKNPKAYTGSFDKAIPISKEDALRLIDASTLHSFEDDGEDLLNKETSVDVPVSVQAANTPAATPKDSK